MPFLYIVATPIGNLKDFSERAVETLKKVDLILCEDTRVTKKLLDHYRIKKSVLSYHQHTKLRKIDYIVELLKRGENIALVSDAGTPGISDPGNRLIEEVVKILGEGVEIFPIPGPSALTAALSISGFPTDRFLFLGFPPQKRKRKKFFGEVLESKYPVVFYESPYRIIKTLNELKKEFLASECDIEGVELVLCRELTKMFETTYRGDIEKVIKDLEKDKIKGEFVVIVNKK